MKLSIYKAFCLPLLLSLGFSGSTLSATFTDIASEPFDVLNGVEFQRHTGRFQGETSLGAYDVPFEIVAPADPSQGTGTIVFEPPHWAFPTLGRDLWIGHSIIFGRGMSYATVGFGVDGFNILDPLFPDPVIAGSDVADPGALRFAGPSDEEILIQFVQAITSDADALNILGPVQRTYAFGVSRSADILVAVIEAITGTENSDLFDLTMLHIAGWEAEPPDPGLFPGGLFDHELAGGAYSPRDDVGRVVFIQSEGDLLVSDAELFELAVMLPGYRVYQVAGSAHLPTADNPLDHIAVLRSIVVAADEWMRFGIAPPPSTLIDAAPVGQIDPIYGIETGIARDADGNALGGIRLPEVEIGQALYVASDPATSTLGIPALGPLSGSLENLFCEPFPGSGTNKPRFQSHGEYVRGYVDQANELVGQRFLLPADAELMKETAAETDIGKPGTCP